MDGNPQFSEHETTATYDGQSYTDFYVNCRVNFTLVLPDNGSMFEVFVVARFGPSPCMRTATWIVESGAALGSSGYEHSNAASKSSRGRVTSPCTKAADGFQAHCEI